MSTLLYTLKMVKGRKAMRQLTNPRKLIPFLSRSTQEWVFGSLNKGDVEATVAEESKVMYQRKHGIGIKAFSLFVNMRQLNALRAFCPTVQNQLQNSQTSIEDKSILKLYPHKIPTRQKQEHIGKKDVLRCSKVVNSLFPTIGPMLVAPHSKS